MAYRLIAAEKAEAKAGRHPGSRAGSVLGVARMTQLLGVSRSGFYEWCARQERPPGPRAQRREVLAAAVLAAHADSDGVNGAPRITADLRDAGHRVNPKTVASIMAGLRIQGVSPRPWKVTTVPDPAAGPLPDLVEREFDTGRLDAVWISDITYLATEEGWLYLAVVRDGCSRRPLGWAIEDHMRASLVTAALQMALDQRGSQRLENAIFHADRGSQYTCAEVVELATAHGLACSVGATGVCWDNAMAESFWATLKVEYYYRHTWKTKAAAKTGVTGWINRYITRRRHSALGMLTPLQFELHKRSEHTLAA